MSFNFKLIEYKFNSFQLSELNTFKTQFEVIYLFYLRL